MVLGTSLSRGRGEIFPAGGRWGSRQDQGQGQGQGQGQLHLESAGVARRAGRGGAAGHAVNPSLGAPRRHPWRRGSRIPTPTTPQTLCRCSRNGRGRRPPRQPDKAAALPRPPANCRGWGCEGSRDPPPHGSDACVGRAGQAAQPRPCRVRRIAHSRKRWRSLQGRTCSVSREPSHPRPAWRTGQPRAWLHSFGFTALALQLRKKRNPPANSLTHVPLRNLSPAISIDVSSGLIRFGQQYPITRRRR